MHQVHEKVKNSGIEFLLVNVMENAATVKRAVRQRGYTLPVLLDSTGRAAASYKVWGTPGVYLIDSKGRVVAVGLGTRQWDSPEGVRVLKALNESRAPRK